MDDEKLLAYSARGLIPGPGETEEDFAKRASYCLETDKHVEGLTETPKSILEEAFVKTRVLYGIAPDWVPLQFNNEKLAPWHGGCAWILQINDDSPTTSLLQLRTAFRTQNRYLGLYDRKELIAHELSHMGRMMYEEPRFEEVLAYRSSHSAFRRYWGPIVQSSTESFAFVLIIGIILALDFFFLFSGQIGYYYSFMIVKVVPFFMVLFGILRLTQKQREFSLCLKKLGQIFNDVEKANALIYRFTDSEITYFSKASHDDIEEYISQQKEKSLRGKLLSLIFFDKNP